MKIEIINENTVRFFVSNQDIEERGFTITEIWQNRQRGEQLLWELIDEVQEEIDIEFAGALKIQVSASNAGLEFVIQISREDMNQKISRMLSGEYEDDDDYQEIELTGDVELDDSPPLNEQSKTFVFENFEDVISLYRYEIMKNVESTIYMYDNKYHMNTKQFDLEKKKIEGCLSLILEFARQSNVSEAILSEYGKPIILASVHEIINKYFVNKA